MTAFEQLNRYLRQVERRLRIFAFARGFAACALLALALTLFAVFVANRYEFTHAAVTPLRVLLYLALIFALIFGIALPLFRLTRRRVARVTEQAVPGFGERILTLTEKPDTGNPFTELVAEDALVVARQNPPETLRSSRFLWGWTASGVIGAAVLLWLITAGPGFWGYGASLLWTGHASADKRPLYDIAVQPGNKSIRRRTDQVITARLLGFSAHRVTLHARYGEALKWQEAAMDTAHDGDGFQFVFPAVADPVEYYVQADAMQSKHFKISVRDLPGLKQIRTVLHFPAALQLKDVSDESGGDIRAVIGTRAEVFVLTDRRLEHGALILDGGKAIPLQQSGGNWLKGEIAIEKDGSYHVAAFDAGERIRISDDFFIEGRKDEAPTVRIVRPGRDPRVSPIEELPVTVEAADDFGVRALDLHYSVNGGPEQVSRFNPANGKAATGTSVLYLENFRLAPGDVVSMYATARDANTTSRSDIVFAQAEPFDFKFTQSQQAGGMGMGGGGQDDKISERQKQIIAATWNELRAGKKTRASLEEDAHFLSDLEGKLGEQAKTLAERMGSRELSGANSEFANFSQLMTSASSEMGDAVSRLTPGKWQDALAPEQKALQSLLRAEAIFRDIQVAFGSQGGGAGGSGAQRDLARMFDLELDRTKNQYETGQSPATADANKQQKAIDDAFERLQQLARRQQELAQQQAQQQPFEQRWQEEQLRREAEELRKQLEQLAQNSQGQDSQQSQSGSPAGNSAGGAGGAQSAKRGDAQQQRVNEAMRRAMKSVEQAENEMRQSVSRQDAGAEQRAAAQLAEAQSELNRALHQHAGDSVSDLAQQAKSIAEQQRELASRLKQLYGAQGFRDGRNEASSGGEGEDMPEMNDPDNPRFSFGYRRRAWNPDTRPTHQMTDAERSLATDKEHLAKQLEQLQQGMEQQQQSLAVTAPEASSKMRKALSEAEQKELALRMEKNAQWIREGYGDRNLAMEDSVTAGVEQLSRSLSGVQQALKAGEQGQGGGSPADKTAEALAQVRALRQMLEQAQQRAQNGSQSGSASQGGAQNGNPGQQDGSPGQQGSLGQPGRPQGGANGGSKYSPDRQPALDQHDLQQTIGQLNALRGVIGGRDRALADYLGGTLGYLRNLNANPGTLDSTISQDTVTSLERLEVELSRKLGEQISQGARTGSSELSPEQYRDAVAEYFRKLSQPSPPRQ